MTIEAQNWADRLTAAGNTIEERAKTTRIEHYRL